MANENSNPMANSRSPTILNQQQLQWAFQGNIWEWQGCSNIQQMRTISRRGILSRLVIWPICQLDLWIVLFFDPKHPQSQRYLGPVRPVSLGVLESLLFVLVATLLNAASQLWAIEMCFLKCFCSCETLWNYVRFRFFLQKHTENFIES